MTGYLGTGTYGFDNDSSTTELESEAMVTAGEFFAINGYYSKDGSNMMSNGVLGLGRIDTSVQQGDDEPTTTYTETLKKQGKLDVAMFQLALGQSSDGSDAASVTFGYEDKSLANSTDAEFTSHKVQTGLDTLYPNFWSLNLTKMWLAGNEVNVPVDDYTTSYPCAECDSLVLGNQYFAMLNEYLPEDWNKGTYCPKNTELVDLSIAFQIDDYLYTIPFEAYTKTSDSDQPYLNNCDYMLSN